MEDRCGKQKQPVQMGQGPVEGTLEGKKERKGNRSFCKQRMEGIKGGERIEELRYMAHKYTFPLMKVTNMYSKHALTENTS